MTTIMVVDDEPDLLWAVCSALRDEGYDVVECSDGKQALDALLQARPALALVDVMMPFMSGPELLAAIAKHPQLDGLPVVLMSAVDDPEVRRSAASFLKKPFPLRRLLTVVGEMIAAHGAAHGA